MTFVSNRPSSAVAVCPVGSAFVQVTLSPARIVTARGLNAKPWIVTVWLAAPAAAGTSVMSRSAMSAARASDLRRIR
jgi:hypothetical protein